MSLKFKIGDLVQLKSYCKDYNRLAIITSIHLTQVSITFMDTSEFIHSHINNLILINEGG